MSIRHKNMGPVVMNPFWNFDTTSPYPMTMRVKLDHEINGQELRDAFEEALSVWPYLKDSFQVEEDGNIYFVENTNPLKVHHTEAIVAAGPSNDNRVLSLSYWKDTLTFTGLHSFFDGGSIFMIMRITICRYLSTHYGKNYDVGPLPAPGDGAKEENYEFYVQRADIAAQPYEYKDAIWTSADCFMDPKTKNQQGKPLAISRVEIPESEFISYCKKHGANPTVMFAILFAQTVYKLYPEENHPFAGIVTMDIRKNIGIPMAIMGQSSAMMLEISREELASRPLEDIVKDKREKMDAQRSKDYLLSRADDMRHAKLFMQNNYSLRLSYFGAFNYGECTPHIKDVITYNDAFDEVHMFALNGSLRIDIMCGTVAEDYANTICQILNEAGVGAKVTQNHKALQPVSREN